MQVHVDGANLCVRDHADCFLSVSVICVCVSDSLTTHSVCTLRVGDHFSLTLTLSPRLASPSLWARHLLEASGLARLSACVSPILGHARPTSPHVRLSRSLFLIFSSASLSLSLLSICFIFSFLVPPRRRRRLSLFRAASPRSTAPLAFSRSWYGRLRSYLRTKFGSLLHFYGRRIFKDS